MSLHWFLNWSVPEVRLYLPRLCAGCQNKKLLPLLEGAPNFRQARLQYERSIAWFCKRSLPVVPH